MPDDEKIALRFGNYEVFSRPDGKADELGRGGFGRTFRARHRFLRKVVALKVINDELARNETAKRRFLREAREHSALEHPGIARLTDFGEAEGTFFYALEHCPGGDLKDYVTRRGALPPAEALRLVKQTAEALQFAHNHDIMHRDVKPSNLLLVEREDDLPQVKLIDFGLVKHLAQANADETLDRVSGSLWSATFASPEQILEKPLDERTDIFSLGMTAWFLMLGSGPVEGAQMEIIQERLSPESYEPRLPPCLTGVRRRVVAKMLEKDGTKRYRNCAELLSDLTKAIDQTEPSQKTSIPVPPVRPRVRMGDRFSLKPAGSDGQGEIFTGFDSERGKVVRITRLSAEHPSAVVKKAETIARQLTASRSRGLTPLLEMKQYAEGWAIVEEAVSGTPVADVLRRCGPVPLSAIAPLLDDAAAAIDAAVTKGARPLPVESGILEDVTAGGAVNWASARIRIGFHLMPPLPGWTAGSDLTAAPVPATPLQSFAAFIYLAAGGRRISDKALFASSAYVSIPGLGSDANRTLAGCLAGEKKPADCRELLQSVLRDERLSPHCMQRKPVQPPEPAPAPFPNAVEESVVMLRAVSPPQPPSREAILLTPAIVTRPAASAAKPRSSGLKAFVFAALALAAFGFGGWYWKVTHRRQGNPARDAQPVVNIPAKKSDPPPEVKTPVVDAEAERKREAIAVAEKLKIEAARKALEEIKTVEPINFPPPSVDRRLSNGRDLTGWKGSPAFWTMKDGAITAQTTKDKPLKEATWLVWDGEVRDFGLKFRYRMVNSDGKTDGFGNSGVVYRGRATSATVLGSHMDFGGDNTRSGVLSEEKGRGLLALQGQKVVLREGAVQGKPDIKVVGMVGKPDDIQAVIRPSGWNECLILAKGGHVQHFINGKPFVDVTDESPDRAKAGVIAFEFPAGVAATLELKDIVLMTEKAAPASPR
jgi:tRNA A-37 threonylcarbamoyl transferase component Bud32